MKSILKENERIDDLECNGLKIIQNKNKFCFGIDSVLLSDFAKDIKSNSNIIDLGAGTGIISILLCEKIKPNKIVSVEIQEDMCEMMERSVKLNKLENKIEIINADIKELDEKLETNKYDAIITNPPYKKAESGIMNKKECEYISRHEVLCNLEDIIKVSYKLLKSGGSLYMVHRPERLADIMYYLRKYKIEPKLLRLIQPKESKEPNILLIKATKNAGQFLKIQKPMIVYKENGEYTEEVLKIYGKEKKTKTTWKKKYIFI